MVGLVRNLCYALIVKSTFKGVLHHLHAVLFAAVLNPLAGASEPTENLGITYVLTRKINTEEPAQAGDIKDAVMEVQSLAPHTLKYLGNRLPREEHKVEEVGLIPVREL